MTAPPLLSVVVPAVNTLADLEDCLRALEAQRADVALEALVVVRLPGNAGAEIARRFPWVRTFPVPAGTTIPQMRALAIRAATGDAVGVIEDHVLVPPGWARRMLEALGEGHQVVGGAVANAATARLVDRAAFLCEYSQLIPPIPAGEVDGLTGNNVVYRRALLQALDAVLDEGRWEDRLHAAIRASGVPLTCRPDIVVGHKKHYTVGEYVSQRYLYARSYAGARVAGAPRARRLAYGLAALALPPVLLARIVRRLVAKRYALGTLVVSLPLQLLFVSAWGLGEVVGYVAGPGDALGRVC